MKKIMMALMLTASTSLMADKVTVNVTVTDASDAAFTQVGIKPVPKGATLEGTVKNFTFDNFNASGTFTFDTSAEDATVQFKAMGGGKQVNCVAKLGDADAKTFKLKGLSNVRLAILEKEGSQDPKDYVCRALK